MAAKADGGNSNQPALPWMRVPISIESGTGVNILDVPGMDSRLKRALMKAGGRKGNTYKELFPVQSVVWTESGGGLRTAHDLCIAAPTGSGKTLAYALPIVNALASYKQSSTGHHLSALIVLPTRDLAQQVADVMSPLCSAFGLNLQLAAAQVSMSDESESIHGRQPSHCPVSLDVLTQAPLTQRQTAAEYHTRLLAADILVATPGRLIAHLHASPSLSLAQLRFLVVDEADRLLRQSYQEWLPQVMALLHSHQHQSHAWQSTLSGTQLGALHALKPAAADASATDMDTTGTQPQPELPDTASGVLQLTLQTYHNMLPAGLSGMPRCVKMIVSATLTRDPSKLQRLMLHCPRFVAVTSASGSGAGGQRYQLPKTLQEYRIMCSAARKPQTLLALLNELRGQSCIVFASSVDTTHKLYLLLKAVLTSPAFGASADDSETTAEKAHMDVVEVSGHKSAASQRAAALAKFKSGQATILVASDVVTRGLDLDGVECVINYDAPVYAKTYVHRAGRTARAGKSGKVFTLLKEQDVRHFKSMLRKADNTYVAVHRLQKGAADAMAGPMQAALQQVSELLAAEEQDDKKRLQPRDARRSGAPQEQQHQQRM